MAFQWPFSLLTHSPLAYTVNENIMEPNLNTVKCQTQLSIA